MGVSMPVAWDELPVIGAADQWTIKNATHRQRTLGTDPWAAFWRCRQGLTAAMRRAIGMR
jgi:bifunctional non-homologous end joining protein LigD